MPTTTGPGLPLGAVDLRGRFRSPCPLPAGTVAVAKSAKEMPLNAIARAIMMRLLKKADREMEFPVHRFPLGRVIVFSEMPRDFQAYLS